MPTPASSNLKTSLRACPVHPCSHRCHVLPSELKPLSAAYTLGALVALVERAAKARGGGRRARRLHRRGLGLVGAGGRRGVLMSVCVCVVGGGLMCWLTVWERVW
jgi:hypothetical protein